MEKTRLYICISLIAILILYLIMVVLGILLVLILSGKLHGAEKYELECDRYLIELSRDSLFAQVGIQEATGNNDGETLKYQTIFGLKNIPYCAAGQDWCYWVNAKLISDIPFKMSANAQFHFNWAKKHGLKVAFIAEVDDFIVWGIRNKSTGHIERIIIVYANGWVGTIGFNTSNGKTGSQREGNGVFIRLRHLYNPIGLLLIKGLVGIKAKENYKEGCNYE